MTVAGVGAAAGPSDITLELGTHHPSTHGSLRLRLELDGDVVVSAGRVVSRTSTVKAWLEWLPAPSVAVTVTVVVPSANVAPEAFE